MNKRKSSLKNYLAKQKVQEAGITLIALVVTIIILLILAGVSISTLSGQNGLMGRARNAVDTHQRGSVIEKAQQDLIEQQLTNAEGGSYEITKAQLETILNKYFDGVADADVTNPDQELTANDDNGGENVKVKISDIYDGTLAADKEIIGTDESALTEGYYVQKNGKWCIVFADLAVPVTETQWNNDSWSNFSYGDTSKTYKKYEVDGTFDGVVNGQSTFGTKKVLKVADNQEGKENRFYVMALEDVDSSTHYWYYNAYGKLDSTYTIATNYNDFGAGRTNTTRMIAAWNTPLYGDKNDNDMWGIIQNNTTKQNWGELYSESNPNGWFIPSKAEWSAFGYYLYSVDSYTKEGDTKITTSNYGNYGLKSWYWSSAQYSTRTAYYANFNYGYIYSSNVYGSNRAVRFCSTF